MLEDNVRVPSGVALRRSHEPPPHRAAPSPSSVGARPADPEEAPALLRRTLEDAPPRPARRQQADIVLLTDGPGDSAYFEHRMLAEAMGVPLVDGRRT